MFQLLPLNQLAFPIFITGQVGFDQAIVELPLARLAYLLMVALCLQCAPQVRFVLLGLFLLNVLSSVALGLLPYMHG